MRLNEGMHLEQGLAVVAAQRAGYALSGEVIAFRAAHLAKQGDHAVLTTNDAASLHFAYYTPKVLENGWQPYDQPSAAAYLPLDYSELDRFETSAGAMLIERKAEHERLWREIVTGTPNFICYWPSTWSEAATCIQELARRNGICDRDAKDLATRIQERLSSDSI